jgi:hypothetical protein
MDNAAFALFIGYRETMRKVLKKAARRPPRRSRFAQALLAGKHRRRLHRSVDGFT